MDKPLVTILYTLADGKRIRLDVTSEVRDFLERSDRQIRSQRRQDRRYLIFTGCIEEFEEESMAAVQEDVADLVIRIDSYNQLYTALDKLSETQRRRLEMRFHDELTYRRIAEIENVSDIAVIKSVKQALNILRKHLSK